MTKTDETNLHSVAVNVVDGEAKVAFTCAGTRTSACHVYPDAEEWSEGDGQERVEHDDCWIAGWFDWGGMGASYAGVDAVDGSDLYLPPPVARTGTIDVTYEGGYITWHFENVAAATAAAEEGPTHDEHA